MYCKNCKFWKRNKIYKIYYECKACDDKWYGHTTYEYDKTYYEKNGASGYYKNVSIEELPLCKYGECCNDRINYVSTDAKCIKDYNGTDLIYCDNEAYAASHLTGENFGCIAFCEKD